jgi:hypothetical protein
VPDVEVDLADVDPPVRETLEHDQQVPTELPRQHDCP